MNDTFQNRNPYIGFDSKRKILINKLGDICKIMKIEFPLFLTKEEDYFKRIIEDLNNEIKDFPEDYIIQRISFISKRKLKEKFTQNKKDSFYDKEFKKMHANIPQKKTEHYIILIKRTELYKPTYNKNLFNENNLLFKPNYFNKTLIQKLNSDFEKLIESFKDFDCKVKIIKDIESINDLIYNKYFNLSFLEEFPTEKGLLEQTDSQGNSYTHIGSKLVKVYSISSNGLPENQMNENETDTNNSEVTVKNSKYGLPQSLGADLQFQGADLNKIYVQTIMLSNPQEIDDFVYSKQKLMDYDKTESKQNKQVPYDKDYFHLNRLVYNHIGVIIIGSEEKTETFFKELEQEKRIYKTLGITISENPRNNIRYFFLYSFGNSSTIPKEDTNIIPLKTALSYNVYETLGRFNSEKDTSQGLLFKERFSNTDYYLDLINPNSLNRNILLFGASGTGKSVALGALINNFHKQGAKIFLSDIGFSQKTLCQKLNGIYLEMTEENPLKIEPFSFIFYDEKLKKYILDIKPNPKKDKKIEDYNKNIAGSLENLKELFFLFWLGGEDVLMTENQAAVISKTITKYIKYINQIEIKANYNGYFHYTKKLFEEDLEFKDLTENVFSKQSYMLVMSEYLSEDEKTNTNKGSLNYLIGNNDSFLKKMKNNRFVVFENEKIKDNQKLFAISSYLQVFLSGNSMLNEENQLTVFAIDEAHQTIKSKAGLLVLDFAYRTARKHDGIPITATQSITDFDLTQPICISIIKNTSIFLIKKQDEDLNTREDIKKALGIEDDQSLLNTLYSIDEKDKYKSLFIKIDSNFMILNLVVDETHLIIGESEKEKRARIQKAITQKNGNVEEAVKSIMQKTKKEKYEEEINNDHDNNY